MRPSTVKVLQELKTAVTQVAYKCRPRVLIGESQPCRGGEARIGVTWPAAWSSPGARRVPLPHPHKPLQEAWSSRHTDLGLLASRTMRMTLLLLDARRVVTCDWPQEGNAEDEASPKDAFCSEK